MSIRSLCNYNVATVEPTAGIMEVAAVMRESHVGDVIVVERQGEKTVPVGIVTDRDLVIEVLAEGVSPGAVTVADIMSRNVVTVREDSGLGFALHEMARAGVRRLPVLDERGAIVGIITIDDAVAYIADLTRHVGDALQMGQFKERRERP